MEIRLRIWKDLSSSEKDLCRGREEQDEFKSSVLEQVCNSQPYMTGVKGRYTTESVK